MYTPLLQGTAQLNHTHITVTYNANGADSGSVPTDATEYELNDIVTVLGNTGNLVRAGYSFGGWRTIA